MASVVCSFYFGGMNSNFDQDSTTPDNSRQEIHCALTTNTQNMKTGQDDGRSVTETQSKNYTR